MPLTKRPPRRRRKTKPKAVKKQRPPMSQERKQSLIDEIDSRQNELLDRLAELNSRVETLLDQCLKSRDATLELENAESDSSTSTDTAGQSTPAPIAKPHAPLTSYTPESETV